MEFTGERSRPGLGGGTALERGHRYLLAALYARGKDVLDIASGEGHGSAILADAALSVVGLDASPEFVARAQGNYAARNLRFLQGGTAAIPLPDASVDMAVCFEAAADRGEYEDMLREIKRVLRPGGLLCMSFPARGEYSGPDLEEFRALLSGHFRRQTLAGQRLVYGSLITRSGGPNDTGEFLSWREGSPQRTPAPGLPHPACCLALASDGELPPPFSGLMEGGFEHDSRYLELEHEAETLRQRARLLERLAKKQTARARELESQAHDRDTRIRALEGELRAMAFSRSWRVTAPLRRVAAWLRERRSGIAGGPAKNAAAPAVPKNNSLQDRVAAFKSGVDLGGSSPVRDVRIYVAAEGNHFFREIGALIQCGFADIGIRAELVAAGSLDDCANPANAGAGLHLVIAPHELFHFIPQARKWPHAGGALWMLNTEQAHTEWFAKAKSAFSLADCILDMDIETAAALARMGYAADHLPLGFSPACRLFDGAAPVESNLATMGIPARIRNWTVTGGVLETPLAGRPLDCCFFGASTPRRVEFFARHAALFAGLESYLRLQPLAGPLRVGVTTPLSTECTSSIVRRSKVSCNIHQAEHSYFEWHRIVLQGIRQGAVVLSEPCTPAWPFRPNIDYIETDLGRMADTLEYLLRSAEGRSLAERVRARAWATLTEHCRMGGRLEELLRLHTAAGTK